MSHYKKYMHKAHYSIVGMKLRGKDPFHKSDRSFLEISASFLSEDIIQLATKLISPFARKLQSQICHTIPEIVSAQSMHSFLPTIAFIFLLNCSLSSVLAQLFTSIFYIMNI